MWQHEVLFALQGHEGEIFIHNVKKNCFEINGSLPFLSIGERQVILSLLPLGMSYKYLSTFTSSQDTSLGQAALKVGIDEILQEYEDALLNIETQILSPNASKEVFSLASFTLTCEPFKTTLPHLESIVKEITSTTKDLRRELLIDTLYAKAQTGYPDIKRVTERCIYHVKNVLCSQIQKFVLQTELIDPFQEFFIYQSSSTKSSKRLNFELNFSKIPTSVVPLALAEKILMIGNAMVVVLLQEEGDSSSSNDDDKTPFTEFKKEWEIIEDSPVFQPRVVSTCLEKLRQYVAAKLWNVVVRQGRLLEHVLAMKNLFLLGKGEFFDTMIKKSAPMMRHCVSSRTEKDLNMGPLMAARAALSAYDNSFDKNQLSGCNNVMEGVVESFRFRIPTEDFDIQAFESCCSTTSSNNQFKTNMRFSENSTNNQSLSSTESESMNFLWCSDPKDMSKPFVSQYEATVKDWSSFSHIFMLQSRGVSYVPTKTSSSSFDYSSSLSSLAVEITASSIVLRSYSNGASSTVIQSESLKHDPDAVLSVKVKYDKESTDDHKPSLKVFINNKLCLQSQLTILHQLNLSSSLGECFIGIVIPSTCTTSIKSWSYSSTNAATKIKESDKIWKQWKKLSIDYDVEWPIHLVISPDAVSTYKKLFRFLFPLKRITLELQECWSLLMAPSRDEFESTAHKLRLLRARMNFLLNNLLFYMQVNVIDSQYRELERIVSTSIDIEAVQSAHANYLAALTKKCYLSSKTVRDAIDRVLCCCHEFCNAVRTYEEEENVMKTQLWLEALDVEFSKSSSYLFTVLYKTTAARDLVLHLNFNEYFSNKASELAGDIMASRTSPHLN